MKLKVSELVGKIYNLLDENESIIEERVEYGDPGAMLRPLIEDLLPDAARMVIKSADISEMDDCISVAGVRTQGAEVLTAVLPEDFMRLVFVRMSDWKYGVSVSMDFESEQYQLRRHPRHLRRPSAPAVAVRRQGSQKVLEIFGSTPEATVDCLDYICLPDISGKYINLPKGLVTSICTRTAEMVKEVIS